MIKQKLFAIIMMFLTRENFAKEKNIAISPLDITNSKTYGFREKFFWLMLFLSIGAIYYKNLIRSLL
jgi:hypothetical protein